MVADGANQFAFDLYARLDRSGNAVISPYSIHTALAMTSLGARGATATEMATLLHLPGDLHDAQLAAALGGLMRRFVASNKDMGFELHVANALWGQSGVQWDAAFTDSLKSQLDAAVQDVDFADEPAARGTINGWVAERTAGKIADLIPAGALDRSTRLVLTNAVYFKADWLRTFPANATRDDDFHVDGAGDATAVATMHDTASLEYAQTDQLTALQMRYTAGNIAMLLLLPKSVDGLGDLEAKLNPATLADIVGKLQQGQVVVSLPKFTLNMPVMLKPILGPMGMRSAFSTEADFSGMDGKRDLYIGSVLHKAFIHVDEKGTEAAAATGVVARALAIPGKRFTFRADHPFVFVLRDVKTGVVLFMGRVMDPRK